MITRRVISRYSDSANLCKDIRVYSLEEILVEKMCALIGRTEPRDLYDAHFLLGLGDLDYESVLDGFSVKAKKRGIDPTRLLDVLREREPTIARLWRNRLALQVDNLPHLQTRAAGDQAGNQENGAEMRFLEGKGTPDATSGRAAC